MYKPARRMAVAATTMTGKLRGVDHVAAAARRHVGNLMFLGNSPRPRDRGAAEQGHELAPFQLIELNSIPASQGRISGYRIGKDQSGGIRTILQPVFSPMSALGKGEILTPNICCPDYPERGYGCALYEYTPFCNGPGDVKSPRV